MNYEKLENQSADSKNSIKFLPKSMRDYITKSADTELKHRNWTVDFKKKVKQSGTDLFHKELQVKKVKKPDTNLGAEVPTEDKSNLVLGSSALVLMLLAYLLFFRG
jgi:hypothetical protein